MQLAATALYTPDSLHASSLPAAASPARQASHPHTPWRRQPLPFLAADAATTIQRRGATPQLLTSSLTFTSAVRTPTGVSCSAYSRTSWRAAILEEDSAPADRDSKSDPENRATNSSAVERGLPSPGGEEESDGRSDGSTSGAHGTLTAAELRVKLALAAGSGRLDLTDCRLTHLPPEVLELTELEELQLSGNCLTALPEEISRLTALQRLGLAGNLLSSLPEGIGALTALEGLWLHGNLLTSLPQQLGRLGALRALSIAGNCLDSVLAGALSGLTSLTDLTLAGNRLSALPPRELAPLSRLRKLALNGNLLTSDGASQLGLGPHMTALTELMLQGNRLEALDPHVFECPALKELSVADNQLAELPPRLAAASSLARLHLFGNRLTALPARQLASLPALTTCWLEGNPLDGSTVSELIAVAGAGGMPQLKVLGLDSFQLAAAVAARPRPGGQPNSSSSSSLPPNVRVGCVLGSGPGYFKLQYGPQRTAAHSSAAGGDPSSGHSSGHSGGGTWEAGGVRSSNELLVVAFGSAPGTPNWGGLLSKVYRAAASDDEKHFDVLYVADPARDWYGGGDDELYGYYRERLSAYTRHYRRVLLLGDSMGATAALLFSDLATCALAFCPQVDLTEASIRPGRPAAWLDRLRQRLVSAVRVSRGELDVLVGTWQHDLSQANLLPAAARGSAGGGADRRRDNKRVAGAAGAGSRLGSWREDPGEGRVGAEAGSAARAPAGAARQRRPWAWERPEAGDGDRGEGADGGSSEVGGSDGSGSGSDGAEDAAVHDGRHGDGGVSVKVFSVDSHRLAAALDAQGKLVPLVRDAILHQLGKRSRNVRLANML